jgi:hypothetical protein
MFSVSASSTHLITALGVIHVLNGNAGAELRTDGARLLDARGPISPNHVLRRAVFPACESVGLPHSTWAPFGARTRLDARWLSCWFFVDLAWTET